MGVHACFGWAVRRLAVLTAAAVVSTGAAAAPPTDRPDFYLGTGFGKQLSRSLAFDPLNPKRVVAAIQDDGGCQVKISTDGGASWGQVVPLPAAVPGTVDCDDPVVTFAPDGGRIHAVFGANGANFPGNTFHTSSMDGGRTWSAPTILPQPQNVVYPGLIGEVHSRKLATPLRAANAKYLYLAASLYIGESMHGLGFTSSSDGGTTWTPWTVIAVVSKNFAPWNQGVSVAGGLRGRVSLVWDEGDEAGILRIRVAQSTDYGASFLPAITAASETPSGIAYPFGGSPDAKFGPEGRLHVVYSRVHNGVASVRYVSTTVPSYATWSKPVTVSDAAFTSETIVAPLLAIERCGTATLLHVSWLDGRRGRNDRDIFYSQKVLTAESKWSANIQVSDSFSSAIPPTDPYVFDGPFTALAAAGGRTIALWNYDYPYYPFSAVVGSRIDAGLTCQ